MSLLLINLVVYLGLFGFGLGLWAVLTQRLKLFKTLPLGWFSFAVMQLSFIVIKGFAPSPENLIITGALLSTLGWTAFCYYYFDPFVWAYDRLVDGFLSVKEGNVFELHTSPRWERELYLLLGSVLLLRGVFYIDTRSILDVFFKPLDMFVTPPKGYEEDLENELRCPREPIRLRAPDGQTYRQEFMRWATAYNLVYFNCFYPDQVRFDRMTYFYTVVLTVRKYPRHWLSLFFTHPLMKERRA